MPEVPELHVGQRWAYRARRIDDLVGDHPDLKGLAQADRVGDQDLGPNVLGVGGFGDRGLLVGQGVGKHVGRDGEGLVSVGHRRLTAERFES